MTGLVHSEQALAWELRAAWGRRTELRLTLSERAMVQSIVGYVSQVAVTGAFVVIDGWHVPTVEVLGVGKPTNEDRLAYRKSLEALREAGKIDAGGAK